MKKLVAIICFLMFAFAATAATLRLDPGLSAPGVADGARLDAAALLSTNAVATAQVAAVYELPVYGDVETVTTNTRAHYVLSTNVVIGTNGTYQATDLYTLATNPTYQVTDIYTVTTNQLTNQPITNYYYIATNYFTVWTNSFEVMVNRPTVSIETNHTWDIVDMIPRTNELFSLSASTGYAETNRIDRWIFPGARLLVTGDPVILIFR